MVIDRPVMVIWQGGYEEDSQGVGRDDGKGNA